VAKAASDGPWSASKTTSTRCSPFTASRSGTASAFAPPTWPSAHSSRNAVAPKSSADSNDERSAIKFEFATMIGAAERWCRVSISDLEHHQRMINQAAALQDAQDLTAVGFRGLPAACGSQTVSVGSLCTPSVSKQSHLDCGATRLHEGGVEVSWLDQSSVVGMIAAGVTGIGILTKFSERRPLGSLKAIVLSVLIIALSGGAAFGISHLPAGRAGVLGVGAAFPFWTDPPGTGGSLKRSSNPAATLAGQLISFVWAITGFLASSLDRQLTKHKIEAVQKLSGDLTRSYTGANNLVDGLEAFLQRYARGLTNEADGKKKLARLRLAYEESIKRGCELGPLVGLIYDWKIEDLARKVVVVPAA
jgi:hypothetical protein